MKVERNSRDFALKNLSVTKIGNRKHFFYEHPSDRSFRWEGTAWDKREAMSKVRDAYEEHSAKKLKEDVPTNATGPAVVGTDGQAFPNQRHGSFAGHKTVRVNRRTFAGLTEAKRKGKHWRKYLEEDESFQDVREYAYATKGPIVVEDEDTGYCMFVRYGNGNMFEAVENSVGKTKEWKSALSDAGKKAREVRQDARNNYGKDSYLGTFRGHRVRRTTFGQGDAAYHLEDPKTGEITHSVNGSERNGVLKIGGASSTGKSPVKMHDFYHHLLKKHLNAVTSDSQSPGAQAMWRRLAKKKVTVHGWLRGKPVNLDPQDPMETHGPKKKYGKKDTRDRSERDAANTTLVASVAKE